MNLWNQVHDDVHRIERDEELSVDQRLKVAEILAMLTISQELSMIQDQGINPEWSQRQD